MTTTLAHHASNAEGIALRDEAHGLLEAHRAVWLLRLRRAFAEALLRDGSATTDAARFAVELPAHIDPKVAGAVPKEFFSLNLIRRGGYVLTTRPIAHARPVMRWELCDRAGVEGWLTRHPDAPDAADGGQTELFDTARGGVR